MAKPFKKALTISTCMLVAVACTIGAVAWFAAYKNIGNMGFQTSSNAELPEMKMWMYYSQNDADNDTSTNKPSEGWVEQTVSNDPSGQNEFIIIPGVGEQTSTGTNGTTLYSYDIPKLHFGKVDNLVTLKPDNKVMLRFFFDASMLNNPDGKLHDITFTLAYNTTGYTYNQNQESVLDSIYLLKEVDGGATKVNLKVPANQTAIDSATGTKPDPIYVLECLPERPGAMQFLQIRYAVSSDLTNLYAPVENDFQRTVTTTSGTTTTTTTEVLTLSSPIPINCGYGSKNQNCTGCVNNNCGQVTLSESDLKSLLGDPVDGAYNIGNGFYVYIELAPMLDAFGMQENILDYFVPAYMLFDVKLDVEIG